MATSDLTQDIVEAARAGYTDQVRQALKDGTDIHDKDDKLLRVAAMSGRKETVKMLLDRGADIHALNDDALCYSALRGYKDTVELLLDRGADIHARNDEALRGASVRNQPDTVKLLLDRGADIHALNDEPLRLAAEKGYKHMVTLLLDRGADINAESDYALWRAAMNGHKEVVKLLLDRGADIHTINELALRVAAENDHKDTALVLLRGGSDPKTKGDNGKDAFKNTNLTLWLDECKKETSRYFRSKKTLREKCFVADNKTHDIVLDACVTGQFTTLIGAPLIASTDKTDRMLFQDIWEALPTHWQEQNQNIYMQFVKEGGVNPVVGLHTDAVQRDFTTSDSVVER